MGHHHPPAQSGHNAHPNSLLADLGFEHIPIEDIHVRPGHARKNDPEAVKALARSISELGFAFPLVIDDDNTLIAGHLRLAVARSLAMTVLPVVRVKGLSKAQAILLSIVDNQMPTLSSFDEAALRQQFQIVLELNPEIDLTVTGFGVGQIDVVLEMGDTSAQADLADDVPEPEEAVTSRQGDIFHIGPHRIVVGDGRDLELLKSLSDEAAVAAFIDPPFNVSVAGHVSGLGKKTHAEFAGASGELSPEAFTSFLTDSLRAVANACVDGGVIFVCMDWRHMREMLDAGKAAELSLQNLCVWNKTNAGMGSLYRSQHELVFVFKVGTAPHINNVRLGAGGRYRTNVWTHPGANTFRKGRDQDLADHPTVKPAALVANALKDVTKRGQTIIDTFLGSGTTLIAAHRTGRRCIGVEIESRFVDVAIRRFAALFPDVPITHAQTRQSFAALREQRLLQASADGAENWNIL